MEIQSFRPMYLLFKYAGSWKDMKKNMAAGLHYDWTGIFLFSGLVWNPLVYVGVDWNDT
jgi:hypothetical protein